LNIDLTELESSKHVFPGHTMVDHCFAKSKTFIPCHTLQQTEDSRASILY